MRLLPIKILFFLSCFFTTQVMCGQNGVFLKNNGQILLNSGAVSNEVLFTFKTESFDVFFQKNKVSYVFKRRNSISLVGQNPTDKIDVETEIYRLDLELLSSNLDVNIIGKKPISLNQKCLNSYASSIEIGEGHKELIYKNVYKGIDLVFYADDKGLKYDFIVHPNADYQQIKFKYNGGLTNLIDNQKILIETPLGNLMETIPESYQTILEKKKHCNVFYELNEEHEIIFNVGDYDKNEKLIIDPWATFVGGTDVDESYSIYNDSQFNTYVTGITSSLNFPVTVGVLQTVKQGQYDAFLTKLDATGNVLWSTFYGGIGDEFAYKILVDSDDNPYIIGYTNGNDILVSSSGVAQSSSNGSYDSFIVKLNSAGNFIWGTYFGGSGGEFVFSADIDSDNNILVGGYTSSTDMPTVNSFQGIMGGALDAFVAKFDSTGNLLWSTYCGGSNSEDVHALHVDDQDNVIIAGETYSSDFPTSSGAYQGLNAGNADVFVVKYTNLGNRIFATYFGGMNREDANGLNTDLNGNIYVVGYTESANFPMLGTTPYQTTKNGMKDGFVAKFTGAGVPTKSTFIGGTDNDWFTVAEVSSAQELYVAGYTSSLDMPIISVPYQLNNMGLTDGVYYKLDTNLTPNYSTYFGGVSADYTRDLILSGTKPTLTFCGFTSSPDFPVTTNVFQDTLAGQSDAFVFQTDSVFNFVASVSGSFKTNNLATIHPNPFHQYLYISINKWSKNEVGSIIFYSVDGKEIQQNKLTSINNKVDLSHLSKGIYIGVIQRENGESQRVKLIKK